MKRVQTAHRRRWQTCSKLNAFNELYCCCCHLRGDQSKFRMPLSEFSEQSVDLRQTCDLHMSLACGLVFGSHFLRIATFCNNFVHMYMYVQNLRKPLKQEQHPIFQIIF